MNECLWLVLAEDWRVEELLKFVDGGHERIPKGKIFNLFFATFIS